MRKKKRLCAVSILRLKRKSTGQFVFIVHLNFILKVFQIGRWLIYLGLPMNSSLTATDCCHWLDPYTFSHFSALGEMRYKP